MNDMDCQMEDISGGRSLADVDKMIAHAKMSTDDLQPLSQTIHFSAVQVDQTRVKLMEVDKGLAAAIEEGAKLVFRGKDEDGVVLCTEDKTYDVKEAETSNSLLVLDKISWPGDVPASSDRCVANRVVNGVFHTYLEVKEIRPKVKRLTQMLSEPKDRYPDGDGFDTEALLDVVQCSEKELEAALREFGAVSIEGKWYLLETSYKMKVLSQITNFIDENSWPLHQVYKGETLEVLSELEKREVVERV